jgi:hypothetical protein
LGRPHTHKVRYKHSTEDQIWRGKLQVSEMRFRVDVNTLDGKLSYERDTAVDALEIAEGGKQSLGVTITDTEDGKSYSPEEFRKRFGH